MAVDHFHVPLLPGAKLVLNTRKMLVMVGLCAVMFAGAARGADVAAAKPVVASNAAQAAKKYSDPKRFETSILAFEAKDKAGTPLAGGIVCIGSSSMVNWHPTIQQDLAPLKIIARGFGGSTMNDAAFYAERMVVRYRPKAVVLYEGDNDIGAGMSPRQICDAFETFVSTVQKGLPEARIYVISIKPSLKRWNLWPTSVETNKLIAGACAKDPNRLTYVSIVEGMMGTDGKVRDDIFRADKLHMTAKGYEIWKAAIRPVLLAREAIKQG